MGDTTTSRNRRVHWRCFHCGETFTRGQERWAREHFGRNEDEQPVCLIRSAGESALLTALRNAQDELVRYRSEDSDLMRALWAMQADHAAALRREEERGYEKGLRDAKFRPLGDNHHNALLCPHCNPEGLRFADPKQTPGATP